jgi:hypothetical protein
MLTKIPGKLVHGQHQGNAKGSSCGQALHTCIYIHLRYNTPCNELILGWGLLFSVAKLTGKSTMVYSLIIHVKSPVLLSI